MIKPIHGVAAAAALFSSIAFVPAALAQSREPVEIRVLIADLNLESIAGRKALDRRLNGAIKRACNGADARMLAMRPAINACRAEMMANAELALNAVRKDTALAAR